MDNPLIYSLIGLLAGLMINWTYNYFVVYPRMTEARNLGEQASYEDGDNDGYQRAQEIEFNLKENQLRHILGINSHIAEEAIDEMRELAIEGMQGKKKVGEVISKIWNNKSHTLNYRLYCVMMFFHLAQISVLSFEEFIDMKTELYDDFADAQGDPLLSAVLGNIKKTKDSLFGKIGNGTPMFARSVTIDTKGKSQEQIQAEIKERIADFLKAGPGSENGGEKKTPTPPGDAPKLDEDSLLKS